MSQRAPRSNLATRARLELVYGSVLPLTVVTGSMVTHSMVTNNFVTDNIMTNSMVTGMR